ncbi:uncharacterized protein LOC132707418 [Cylas formicarius]|uniref:uncharacterized protein LOC132707418 n=1 Tax=Cylas formicarius TaxID=197179 RepID=UPI0029584BCA|nr:uncharacterized protein LOC132707418 [Cylas formicarius]XP_060535250.1 uncharacterized protein LOC132707418 [Cylas formicarius]
MCCPQSSALSRLGLFTGVIALAALLVAYVSSPWLYTKEPLPLEKPSLKTNITFKIGLWRVCPTVKRINLTIHVPSPACSLVKYAGFAEVLHTDLGVSWTPLDFAQVFITRMRSCTVLCSVAVVLLVAAVFFGLLGHCNNDSKTVVASGFFILGGLSLAAGLVTFTSALSETLAEIYEYHKDPSSGPVYDYRYGWCFFTAGAALVLSNVASALVFVGYLHRYSSVDEMVREMVPGAERKMREHQRLSTEYLVRRSNPSPRHQYDPLQVGHLPLDKYEATECGPLLNKTPPDVCTTNTCLEFAAAADLRGASAPEGAFCSAHSLAGQTIPITIKNHTSLSFSNAPVSKYGTMPHAGTTLHQGFLGVSEVGSSSSNSSSGYCGKSKTLQYQKQGRSGGAKKCVKIESFQVPETSFEGYGTAKRTNNALNYSGSAV